MAKTKTPAAEKAPAKGKATAAKATPAEKVPASAKTAGTGIHKPVTPSADLGAVVGADAQPRSEIISKIWTYIKDNKLQDEKDKRQINADAKLKKIFGKDSVSMFEMNKHISAHVK